jgi:hypothetical protein
MRYRFIAVEKALYPVTVLCRVLCLSKSGFYAWMKRPASRRATTSAILQAAVRVAFDESRSTYGSPRVHAALVAQGWKVSKTRVEREMRKLGLIARRPKRFRITTDSAHDQPIAENILDRKFEAAQPNRVWSTDITYVWTREGWLYLAIIIDLFSRRVVGWATAHHMRTSLVLNALRMAVGRRLPHAGYCQVEVNSPVFETKSSNTGTMNQQLRGRCGGQIANACPKLTIPLIGRVDVGLVTAGLCNTGFKIIRDKTSRNAAHESEGAHVRTDPRGQVV